MNGGYAGQILVVALGSGSVDKPPLDSGDCHRFIGGFGLNNKIFTDLTASGKDPLSPDNPIIIGAGPLVGTMAPGSSRIMATTKYPLTGAVASASGSMTFGAQMKWAGYDHIVIRGKSHRPVYLYLEDEKIRICDASPLWGTDIHQTSEALWSQHGSCGIIAIGPAGENRVKFSLALVERTATIGRGGLTAVMGAKNLKAVAVKGTKGVRVADRKGFLQAVDGLYERAQKFPYREVVVEYGMMAGWLPSLQRMFPHAPEKIKTITEQYGPSVYLEFKKARRACPSCFVADKDVLEVKPGCGEAYTTYPTSFSLTGFRSELYEKATGMAVPPEAMMEAADRSWTLQRLLNAREAFTRGDDFIPDQWFQPLHSEGKVLEMMDYFKTGPLTREDLNQILEDYYDERGWNPDTGYPTREKLESLGLPTS